MMPIVDSKAIRDTILIGDHKVISFKVSVPKEAQLLFHPQDSINIRGLEVIGEPKIDTLSAGAKEVLLNPSITVTGFKDGNYSLSNIPAIIANPNGTSDTLFLDGGDLQINTIQIDTLSYKPYDIKGQMNYPYTIAEFLPWIGGGILVILLITGVWYYFKKIRRNIHSQEDCIKDTPNIAALKQLEAIKLENLCQKNRHKLYYSRVSEVLRVYIESYFVVNAMEYTTAEILSSLRSEKLDRTQYDTLNKILSLSDLVKFAKYIPTEQDNEESMSNAITFVVSTYKIEEEEAK